MFNKQSKRTVLFVMALTLSLVLLIGCTQNELETSYSEVMISLDAEDGQATILASAEENPELTEEALADLPDKDLEYLIEPVKVEAVLSNGENEYKTTYEFDNLDELSFKFAKVEMSNQPYDLEVTAFNRGDSKLYEANLESLLVNETEVIKALDLTTNNQVEGEVQANWFDFLKDLIEVLTEHLPRLL